MKTKILLIIAVVVLLVVDKVQAVDVDFYSDAVIEDGDVYNVVRVFDTPPDHTTVDMFGGSIQAFDTFDSSTVNVYGGEILWSVISRDLSAVNIYGGIINFESLTVIDSSTLNIYGGHLLVGNSPGFSESSMVNIYGYGFERGINSLTGFLSDGSSFTFNELLFDEYSHMNLIEVPEPLVAEIDIYTNTLNLASKGKWVTCYIRLPDDCNVANINPDTILLERRIKPAWAWFNEQQQVAMVKFSRSELVGILEPGEVELTVTGHLIDGTRFEGSDTIRVIDKGRLHGRRVNSNSKIEDGIEYYIQTDKSVYTLGENVQMLYRVTNLRDEEWRLVGFFPIMDIIVEAREGKNFNEIWHWGWDKIHHWGPIVFRLEPGESAELNGIWPQIDLHGSVEPEDHTQVPPGRYRISGVFYPTDSSIAVDITIVKRKS